MYKVVGIRKSQNRQYARDISFDLLRFALSTTRPPKSLAMTIYSSLQWALYRFLCQLVARRHLSRHWVDLSAICMW